METLLYYAYKNKITSNVFINTFMKIYIMKFMLYRRLNIYIHVLTIYFNFSNVT